MIYDTIDNIEQYTGLFENLDIAIDFIVNNDLSELPIGRTDIDGDNVFVMVMQAQTRLTQDAKFETHSKYMDLQTDIEGVELCEVAHGELTEVEAYSEEKDVALFDAELSGALVLTPDRFAVFMVEEPHKPTIRSDFDTVKKAVFKIAYEHIED